MKQHHINLSLSSLHTAYLANCYFLFAFNLVAVAQQDEEVRL